MYICMYVYVCKYVHVCITFMHARKYVFTWMFVSLVVSIGPTLIYVHLPWMSPAILRHEMKPN